MKEEIGFCMKTTRNQGFIFKPFSLNLCLKPILFSLTLLVSTTGLSMLKHYFGENLVDIHI